jgi:molecular chaperone GrpE (heat shock protein)
VARPEQAELARLIREIDFDSERYYNLYPEPPAGQPLGAPAHEAWANLASLTADLGKFRGEIARLRRGVETLRLPAIEAVGLDTVAAQLRGLEGALRNLKQQTEQQGEDEGQLKRLLKDLLGVADALDRVEELVDKQPGAVPEGIRRGLLSVRQLLLDTLGKRGLTPLEANGAFNPHEQMAMGTEPCPGKADGEVSRVLLRGYVLKGQLLRTAQVVVVKNETPGQGG